VLTFDVVRDAAVVVLALVWMRAMLGRWRSDLHELRTTDDGAARAVIAALWGATALVAVFLVGFAVRLVARLGSSLA